MKEGKGRNRIDEAQVKLLAEIVDLARGNGF
jgi:hypothetical protein